MSTDPVFAALTIAPLTVLRGRRRAGLHCHLRRCNCRARRRESAGYTAQLTATPLTPVTLQITTDGQSGQPGRQHLRRHPGPDTDRHHARCAASASRRTTV
ncbi:MAG: hypothetical protein R2838_17055 [Caldilineaceae bacterium]